MGNRKDEDVLETLKAMETKELIDEMDKLFDRRYNTDEHVSAADRTRFSLIWYVMKKRGWKITHRFDLCNLPLSPDDGRDPSYYSEKERKLYEETLYQERHPQGN